MKTNEKNQSPAQATAGPWSVHWAGPARVIYGQNPHEPICTVTNTAFAQANAALIVAAVNERAALFAERDRLRAALEDVRDALHSIGKRATAWRNIAGVCASRHAAMAYRECAGDVAATLSAQPEVASHD